MQFITQCIKYTHSLCPGPPFRSRIFDTFTHTPQERQRRVITSNLQDVPERLSQAQPGLGQPDSIDVRAYQVFVRQVEPWRSDCPGHHLLGSLKEILVM